jgi:hypothetical protein
MLVGGLAGFRDGGGPAARGRVAPAAIPKPGAGFLSIVPGSLGFHFQYRRKGSARLAANVGELKTTGRKLRCRAMNQGRLLPAFALALPTLSACPGADTQDEPAPEQGEPGQAALPEGAALAGLPPDGGPEFNRLVFESSPYLRQHARNPVDWYPWGDEAFARAAAEDKPIFLSIGYATCHWCHVMEHESFEDAEVAALLNASFVSVKVDREERPDVDHLYMTVVQGVTGRGGWPMTIVMTPQREPFFAGTYLPKTGRLGRGGMMDVVPALASAWRDDRASVRESADRIVEYLQGIAGPIAPAPTIGGAGLHDALADQAFAELERSYDATHGGFGSAPKFPVPHRMRFLLRRGAPAAVRMAVDTLDAMRLGGIWDHVGFGFHRYSTDARWLLPHFEKMLYDQALLALAYVEAWQVTGRPELRATAEAIFAYVLRDMTAPEGGFYSAEDADSEGEEGLFYLWRPDELVAALGADDGGFAAELFGVVANGNFADQATGKPTGESILYLRAPLEPAQTERVRAILGRLFDAREKRVHPLKDDKVLTDWNGLMIAALARAGRAFGEPRYSAAAARAADFALARLRGADGALVKRWRNGEAGLPAVLDDYAFLVWGLIEVYQAGFEPRHLEAAVALARRMIADFGDEASGAFFLAQAGRADLLVRAREFYDGAVPSGNAVAALDLLLLARLSGDMALEERGARALAAAVGSAGQAPSGHAQLLIASAFARGPAHEIAIVGARGAADTQALMSAVDAAFLPNAVVVFVPTGDEGAATRAALRRFAPWAADLPAVNGAATAYVCRDFACELPTNDVAVMLRSLDERSAPAADPGGDAERR